MKTNSLCSDDSLRLLLREDEQSGDYRDAARHVESCPHCQQRIGELAAEDDEWDEAQEMLLGSDESGSRSDSGNLGALFDLERRRRRWQRGPTAWTEAMARQLLSPPSHPEMLGRIGRYEVERLIGTGGMGVVFKAFDTELNRPVAVKLLTPYLAGSGAARKRFAREARAAAAVVHEHVVAIHNVETDGEVPFLVMQYVPGESLQSRLDREGPLDLCEILRIGMQTASGLAAAHAQGLVHRDVKPANVLLEKGVERSLLTDFGLARASDDASLTRTGHHLGTPQYMSPEQARGDAVDARSDLFSLGSVMYAMCTGRPPFRAESGYGVLRRITDAEPRPIREINPNIPEWLERLIQKLLAKSLVDRFQTADEVAELLRQCLAHVQQPTSVPLPASLAPHAAGRRSDFISVRKGVIDMFRTNARKLLLLAILYMALSGAAFAFDLVRAFDFVDPNPVYGISLFIAGIAATVASTVFWCIEAIPKRSRSVSSLVLDAAKHGSISNSRQSGVLAMLGTLTIALLVMVLGQATVAPDISGQWTSDEWGTVALDKKQPEKYEGSFTGSDKINSGTVQLTWSRAERRFNGTWRTGDDRSGKMSLRLIDNEIRGAWTASKSAQKESASPRLADLLWTRSRNAASEVAKAPKVLAEAKSAGQTQKPKPGDPTVAFTRVNNFTTGHGKKIACSTDGKLIAVVHGGQSSPKGEDGKGTVEILDAETGKSVVSISLSTKDEEAILAATEGLPAFEDGSLAFSPDGTLLAVGTGLGQVKLFKPLTGELVRALDNEPARLAEQETPGKLKSLKRAMGSVRSLAFSPDGTRLAMSGGSFDDAARNWGGVDRLGELATGPGRLKVWEVKTGALIHDLVGHSHADAVSFSADGNLLASAGSWNGDISGTGVIIWDAQTGKQLRTITNESNGGTQAVVFSPSGNVVAIGSRQFDKTNDTSTTTVSLTNALSGITEGQQTIPGWARPGGFAPDGKSLVVLCGGEAIRFFDTETGAVKREIRSSDWPPGGRWYDFALPPHGRRLAIGGVDNAKKGTVEIWDFRDSSSAATPATKPDQETNTPRSLPGDTSAKLLARLQGEWKAKSVDHGYGPMIGEQEVVIRDDVVVIKYFQKGKLLDQASLQLSWEDTDRPDQVSITYNPASGEHGPIPALIECDGKSFRFCHGEEGRPRVLSPGKHVFYVECTNEARTGGNTPQKGAEKAPEVEAASDRKHIPAWANISEAPNTTLDGLWDVVEVSFMGQVWNSRGAQVVIEKGKWVGFSPHEHEDGIQNTRREFVIGPDNEFHQIETNGSQRLHCPGRYKLDGDCLWLARQEDSLPCETPVRAIPTVIEPNVTYYQLQRRNSRNAATGGAAYGIRGKAPSRPQSIEAVTEVYNAHTAALRSELFKPPIPDLTIEQMKAALTTSAEIQIREGMPKTGKVLQEFAATGRLSHGILLGYGTHDVDENGATIARSIVPTFVIAAGDKVEDDESTQELVVLRPLELIYNRNGQSSSVYGDLLKDNKHSPKSEAKVSGTENTSPEDEDKNSPRTASKHPVQSHGELYE